MKPLPNQRHSLDVCSNISVWNQCHDAFSSWKSKNCWLTSQTLSGSVSWYFVSILDSLEILKNLPPYPSITYEQLTVKSFFANCWRFEFLLVSSLKYPVLNCFAITHNSLMSTRSRNHLNDWDMTLSVIIVSSYCNCPWFCGNLISDIIIYANRATTVLASAHKSRIPATNVYVWVLQFWIQTKHNITSYCIRRA